MHLEGDPQAPRLVTVKTGLDHTRRMQDWAQARLDELAPLGLCGFVFKKDSPSSGLFRVKVYDEHGVPHRVGSGLFARAVVERFPPAAGRGRGPSERHASARELSSSVFLPITAGVECWPAGLAVLRGLPVLWSASTPPTN